MSGETFYHAAELAEFSGTRPLRKEVNGRHVLLIYDDGKLYAFLNQCTHVRVRMNGARVEDGALVCPNHRARFDLTTGNCLVSPIPGELAPLTRFETRLRDGSVEIALSERSDRL